MSPSLDALAAWVRRRLEQLPKNLHYHCPEHTLDDVWPAAMRGAEAAQLDREQRSLVSAAVLFHDLGFLEIRRGHEQVSIQMARRTLPDFGFTAKQVDIVAGMIAATELPQQPHGLLQEIVADADLDVLGREDFFEVNRRLRRELEEAGYAMSSARWLETQIEFLQRHRYFTPWANRVRGPTKRRNIARLELELEGMQLT